MILLLKICLKIIQSILINTSKKALDSNYNRGTSSKRQIEIHQLISQKILNNKESKRLKQSLSEKINQFSEADEELEEIWKESKEEVENIEEGEEFEVKQILDFYFDKNTN
jgi:hypothetical protein